MEILQVLLYAGFVNFALAGIDGAKWTYSGKSFFIYRAHTVIKTKVWCTFGLKFSFLQFGVRKRNECFNIANQNHFKNLSSKVTNRLSKQTKSIYSLLQTYKLNFTFVSFILQWCKIDVNIYKEVGYYIISLVLSSICNKPIYLCLK